MLEHNGVLVLVLCKVTEHDSSLQTWLRWQVIIRQKSSTLIFSKPEGWPSWIRRFENDRIASKLDLENEKRQASSILYSMGEKADDTIDSFKLSDDDQNSYATVRGRFEAYFVKKRKIVFDPVRFYQKRQKEGEPVASFVNDVYALAKYCEFGDLHDELIRDILVVGICDKRSSK